MTTHRRALLVITSLLIGSTGLGACADERAAATADAGGRKILRIAYYREIDVLNALTSQNLVDIHFSMPEGLITTNDSNTYVPVLAKRIPTEDNGLIVHNPDGTVEMTWELHENVRWHDGEAFTGEDVCFTWEFVASEGSQVYNRDHYLGIVDCEMPDDHTVVFTWDDVYGYYAGNFEVVLPQHVLGGLSPEQIVNYTPYNRGDALVGTGPFRFAEWRAGEYIRVTRNGDYWRGPEYPKIDEIVWSFIPDSNTRLSALKAGGYHYGQIQATQVDEVRNLAAYEVHLVSRNSVMRFDLNVETPRGRTLFSNPAVRKAIFHAIDREAIADQLMAGTVTIAHVPINPTSPYHNPDVFRYDFDPERSRHMLDEAGWLVGADGVRTRNGERFAFTMINRGGALDRIAVAQVIQAQLGEVGIAVSFETLESAAWSPKWRSHDWEGLVSAWTLPADPSVTVLYACDGANNMTGLCDPALDEVLQASDRHLAFEDRKPVLDEALALLAEAALTLPIYHDVVPEVVSTGVGNYHGSGTNFRSFWNLYEWTLGG